MKANGEMVNTLYNIFPKSISPSAVLLGAFWKEVEMSITVQSKGDVWKNDCLFSLWHPCPPPQERGFFIKLISPFLYPAQHLPFSVPSPISWNSSLPTMIPHLDMCHKYKKNYLYFITTSFLNADFQQIINIHYLHYYIAIFSLWTHWH